MPTRTKLLMRLGLRGFDKFSSLWECRRSVGLRSIHLAPSCRQMQSHPKESSGLPAPDAAAVGPRWVMLNCTINRRDSSAVAPKNAADSRTSTGRHLRVSFDPATPPASSFLCYDREGSALGVKKDVEVPTVVIAAHADSVLLETMRHHSFSATFDYFVYSAGAGQLPSLSLLPARDFPKEDEENKTHWPRHPRERTLLKQSTGLLRRGDDELLVVELEVKYENGPPRDTVDLFVLRLGAGESQWEHKQAVPIVLDEGSNGDELRRWRFSDRVVPVGDRFLCWVNYASSFLLCDMAAASPKLRYVPLPVAPFAKRSDYGSDDHEDRMQYSRDMCAAGGGTAVRFVTIDPRCCCGGPGISTCARSSFAFTVTTWTIKLSMDEPMTWVKDGVLDCEELWALPGYEGLPRVHLEFLVVSPDNPDVVCFTVSEREFVSYADMEVWMIEVDTRSKALLSVVSTTDYQWASSGHLPAKLQCYI